MAVDLGPIVAEFHSPRRCDREPGFGEQTVGYVLVHGYGRGEYACADVRETDDFEETLNRAVFSERPVEDGKYDVDIDPASRMVQPTAGNRQGHRLPNDRKGSHGRIDEEPPTPGIDPDQMNLMTGLVQ
jgi:hypothetical protein